MKNHEDETSSSLLDMRVIMHVDALVSSVTGLTQIRLRD